MRCAEERRGVVGEEEGESDLGEEVSDHARSLMVRAPIINPRPSGGDMCHGRDHNAVARKGGRRNERSVFSNAGSLGIRACYHD